EFGGFRWTVSSGTDNGTTWSGTANVKKYAKYGVGLYKVDGITIGPGACTGSAFIKVTGRNPITTVAGAVGTAAAVVGVVGLGIGAAKATPSSGDLIDGVMRGVGEGAAAADVDSRREHEHQVTRDIIETTKKEFGWCGMFWVMAMVKTMALMVTGNGAPGAAAPVRLPRIRWRPRIALLSLLSGVLLGLGALVLFQQFSVFYPTRTIAITGLAAGFVAGIAVPSLRRVRAIRRFNRAIAAA